MYSRLWLRGAKSAVEERTTVRDENEHHSNDVDAIVSTS
jgi:hypothetical protein